MKNGILITVFCLINGITEHIENDDDRIDSKNDDDDDKKEKEE